MGTGNVGQLGVAKGFRYPKSPTAVFLRGLKISPYAGQASLETAKRRCSDGLNIVMGNEEIVEALKWAWTLQEEVAIAS